MRRKSSWFVLFFLAGLLLTACQPEPVPTQPATHTASPSIPAPQPSPTAEVYPQPVWPPTVDSSSVYPKPAYPPPAYSVELLPTSTPAPTRTQRPYPTRQPGPTRTPLPPVKPAQGPAGWLWYGIPSEADLNWRARFETTRIPDSGGTQLLELIPDFAAIGDISSIYPSPGSQYLGLQRGSEFILVDVSTGQIRAKLQKQPLWRFLEWLPDDRHFLFVDLQSLQLANAETGESLPLVWDRGIEYASLAPDGKTVAAIYDGNGDSVSDLVLLEAGGGDPAALHEIRPFAIYPGAWSPDSRRLVYAGDCGKTKAVSIETSNLCLYDLLTGAQKWLDFTPAIVGRVIWSPDGRALAVQGTCREQDPCPSSGVRFGFHIYLILLESGEIQAIAEGTEPVWSPDGKQLAFLNPRDEVWAYQMEDGRLEQITNFWQPKEYLYWTR